MGVEVIEYRDKDHGLSAQLRIYYGTDEVNICLTRGSTSVRNARITLHRSATRKLYDYIRYNVPDGTSDQTFFEGRIIGTVQEFSEVAKDFVKKDNDKIEKFLKENRTTEEKREEMKKIMEKIIYQVKNADSQS